MSTDNSVYQVEPDIIVAPHDDRDLMLLLKTDETGDFKTIGITARGRGAGTKGQSLNAGTLVKLPEALLPRQGQGITYVFIEFNGDDAEVLDARVARSRSILGGLAGAGAVYVASERDEIRSLWAVRSAAVGLVGKVDGSMRAIAFVEGTVVPPENLPAFLDDFLAVLSGHGLTYAIRPYPLER